MIARRALFPASFAVAWAAGAAVWAQGTKSFAANEGMLTTVIHSVTERSAGTITALPDLAAWLMGLPSLFGGRDSALLFGIVIVGLAVEWAARALLARARLGIFERHAGGSPMRGLMHGALLDLAALLAMWVAARLMVGLLGPPESLSGKIAHQLMLALLYWRGFNFVFRIWLRPNTPEGRVAPVDDATAARLLVGMNVVIVLPLLVRQIVQFMTATGADLAVTSAAILLVVPVVAAASVYAVWHWRRDMAAWLVGLVDQRTTFHALKLSVANGWWVGGLAFYLLGGFAAVLAVLTERADAMRGLQTVESLLILLLLIETLIHRLTRHLPTEVPTVGDVVAGSVRLALRLVVIVVAADAVLIGALGIMDPAEWHGAHARSIRIAALSTFGLYLLWRVIRYRMDRYIADNPLPSAGFDPDAEEDGPRAATRMRTIMPVLRVVISISILVLGSLLVLSELGINITPLIAGFSVLGLAVSFGSQSLVRDIVSGVFFLAEDSFRVGEYIDGSKVKGTVEGFSVRALRLRHQNGPLHIVPFGQITHITNFSRDWSTVKFNLAFALNTDVELLRKTVKKIGLDMMNEAQFQKELLQPLKMQGLVDIKDMSMIVRFKFTAKPKNPSMIQRMAIRRMHEQLPKLGIEFARPPFAAALGPYGMDPAARQAAQ
jgi:small-conductance mechanosensitive channel